MDIRKLNSEMMILVNASYSELNEEHKKVIEELLPVIEISAKEAVGVCSAGEALIGYSKEETTFEYSQEEIPKIFADFFSHIQSFRWNDDGVMNAVDRFLDVLKCHYRYWYEHEFGEEEFARKHKLSDFPRVKLPSINSEPAEVINLAERRGGQKK